MFNCIEDFELKCFCVRFFFFFLIELCVNSEIDLIALSCRMKDDCRNDFFWMHNLYLYDFHSFNERREWEKKERKVHFSFRLFRYSRGNFTGYDDAIPLPV